MSDHIILSEDSINKNPFFQFDVWYRQHLSSGVEIPEAVSLGTSSADGIVSVRTVLLKGYSENGFVFFTNYNSKKASQLTDNPNIALLFYWHESGRQVRLEGTAEKISSEESDSYFSTRPRASQISAWASNQSSAVPSRHHLEERHEYYNKYFSEGNVDRPPHWGGFLIIPSWFEFWQNDEKRLHDRITYSKRGNNWNIERLAP